MTLQLQTKAGLEAMPSASLDHLKPFEASVTVPSPNHNARPARVHGIACVVLHATADEGDEHAAEAWLCNPRSAVSSHLHVRRDGSVARLVADAERAWHAGASRWSGIGDVNDFSLGWEIANHNDGREAYTDAQYDTLSRLGAWYVPQGIPLEAFVAHAAVAVPAGRRRDPLGFDWVRFRSSVLRLIATGAVRDAGHQLGGDE